MKLQNRRTLRVALLTFCVLSIAAGGTLYRNWQSLRGYVKTQVKLYRYRTGEDPILRGLARGEINPGDSVEKLIDTYPPRRVIRHDEFVTVLYGKPDSLTGPEVIAKDGRLMVGRNWVCDGYEFFNTLTAEDEAAYKHSLHEYGNRIRAAREAAALAVAGFGATFDPWNLPEPDPEN